MRKLLEKLKKWKPIHLCWLFQKYGITIPPYLIGQSSSSSSSSSSSFSSSSSSSSFSSSSSSSSSFSSSSSSALNTGWKNPTATGIGTGYNEWTDPTNAYASDDTRASAHPWDSQSYYNFDFNIPAGATINGIIVSVECYCDKANYLFYTNLTYDNFVHFVGGKSFEQPTSEGINEMGSSTDTWDHVWTADELSNANFRIICDPSAEYATDTTYIDHIKMKIFYTELSSSSSSSSSNSSSSSSSFSSSSSSSSFSFSSSSSSSSFSSSSSSSSSSSLSSSSSSSSSLSSSSSSQSSVSSSSSSSSFSSSSFSSSSLSSSSSSSFSSSFSSSSSSFSSSSSSSSSFSSSFSSSSYSSFSSSSSSSSSESALIKRREVIVKLYDKDDVYQRNLNEALSDFNIEKTLFSGSGPLTLILKTKVDDLASDITLNSKIRIYLRNLWNINARLVYYGYIISIDPVIATGEQQTGITCLGSISKLQNDYVQHTNQLYEGQLSYLAFEVENKAVDIHIKEILDNYRESINDTYGDYDPCMIDDVDNYWADTDYIDTSFSDKIHYRYFTSKHLDAIREITKFLSKNQAAGEFYYYYVDDGDNTYSRSRFHLQKLSTTADHNLQINKHITSLEMRKNIEDMVNTVYFWNEQGVAGEKILMTASDVTSQTTYDKVADRITDAKISTRTQGDLLSKARLKEAKDEKAEMTVVVSDANYDILSFKLGDVINIRDTKQGTSLYPDNVLVIQKMVLNPREIVLELAKPRPDLSTQVESDREFIDKQLIWFGNISTRIDATRLNPGSLHWVTEDITFSATDYRNIQWLGGNPATVGTFKLPNGVNRVVCGGSTGVMSADTTYWLYVDEKNHWCGKDLGYLTTSYTINTPNGTGDIKAGENSLVDTGASWTKDQWKGYVLWVNPTGVAGGEEKHVIAQNYSQELIIEGDRPFRTDKDDCPYQVHPFVLRQTTKMSTSGTADSGSTTTLVDNALDQAVDFWNGYELKITSGDNMGLTRIVNDFVATADRLVFDALPYAIDNTTHYDLYLNPESQIVIITGVANADTNADAGITPTIDAVNNPGAGATIEDVTGAFRAYNALNTANNLITDLINIRLDTSAKTILSDFSFSPLDYSGAFKTGDITWNTSTGAITGGSGGVFNKKGLIFAAAGVATITLNGVTGSATFSGDVTGATITGGTVTGTTFQTATTGSRVKITGSGHEITFLYDDAVKATIDQYSWAQGYGLEIDNSDFGFNCAAGTTKAMSYLYNNDIAFGTVGIFGLYVDGDSVAPFNTLNAISDYPIIPGTNASYNLGYATYKWKDLYLSGNIIVDGTVDGINISVHVANASAHHVKYTNAEARTAITTAGIPGNIVPSVEGTHDLGSSTYNWDNLHICDIYHDGINLMDFEAGGVTILSPLNMDGNKIINIDYLDLNAKTTNPTYNGEIRYYATGGVYEIRVRVGGVNYRMVLEAV